MTDSVPLARAAEVLGLSVSQLRRRISAGAGGVIRGHRGRGGETMIDLKAFRAWLESTEGTRAQLSQPVIRRDALAESLAVVEAVLDEMLRANDLAGFDVHPWRAEQILLMVWTHIQVQIRVAARRSGGLEIPEIDGKPSIKGPGV